MLVMPWMWWTSSSDTHLGLFRLLQPGFDDQVSGYGNGVCQRFKLAQK